ncbi:succinate dehydrogenase/fumarate reductase iron-sulfur subunit [Salinisphaera hydrothermalis]|uniref:Succinate dehydrogenase iron-sulfur subunit n=1 Tax=Salinisphaera hydrothermalis (strain C41B8) TaxID=1304275 RepID=A0A084IPN7_SALHC|nr:2Fe-2S iron-sulfur cluster-binding protein [Salinisphaera hydrothermalis]KEZ78671.1 fumarate reductase iron-sulfur protein [Salinisphaera hydrothermalis C41B8]
MTATLTVAVWKGDADGGFVEHDVPQRANQTVLDVVSHIQRELDPALSYRFACRVGMCGSCAMRVNGVSRWTCRTHVDKVARDGRLTIQPLANLPIVKDLVTDMAPFFDKWERAEGPFVPSETRPADDDFAVVEPAGKQRSWADAAQECIGCGVCYSSCDVVSWNPEYLGPAALNRAWVQMNDERDGGRPARLRAVSGDAGCHACHSQQSCTLRCPMELDPASSIAGLKRLSFKAALRGKL